MNITSPAFINFGMIPEKHTGFGDDLSPTLRLSDIPGGTRSLAVILDDLDVPLTKAFTHWVIWNIPAGNAIPEGVPAMERTGMPIDAVQGKAWGKHRYRGPKPPFFFRNVHRYVFRVYALDSILDIPASSGKKQLLAAMDGHTLDMGEITGTFRRGTKAE